MRGCGLILLWIACVLVGAAVGFACGALLWRLGFELLGSAVSLVGGAIGGILAFIGLVTWWENRERPRRASS